MGIQLLPNGGLFREPDAFRSIACKQAVIYYTVGGIHGY